MVVYVHKCLLPTKYAPYVACSLCQIPYLSLSLSLSLGDVQVSHLIYTDSHRLTARARVGMRVIDSQVSLAHRTGMLRGVPYCHYRVCLSSSETPCISVSF